MKNKLSSKDYQPIRFHRGRPKEGNDLNENETKQQNAADTQEDSEADKTNEEEGENQKRRKN